MKGAIGTRRAHGKMVWWVEIYESARAGVLPGMWRRTHKAPHHFGTAMRMGTKFVLSHYLDSIRLRNEVTGDTILLNELHRGEINAFLFKTVHLV